MSPCLSDDALERVQADLASVAERAHLAGCAACVARHQRIRGELALITGVLRDTPEPRTHPTPARPRRFMPVTVGLAAVAAALLIWVEVAVWRAVTPPPTMQPQEVAAILADVSAALFSVSGDPPTTSVEDPALSLEMMAQELDHALTGGDP